MRTWDCVLLVCSSAVFAAVLASSWDFRVRIWWEKVVRDWVRIWFWCSEAMLDEVLAAS